MVDCCMILHDSMASNLYRENIVGEVRELNQSYTMYHAIDKQGMDQTACLVLFASERTQLMEHSILCNKPWTESTFVATAEAPESER